MVRRFESGNEAEVMAESSFFRAQIMDIVARRRGQKRDSLHDAQAVSLELGKLRRIVAHQAERGHAEIGQDLRPYVVRARVDGQSQLDVGLYRVLPAILERIRADLV